MRSVLLGYFIKSSSNSSEKLQNEELIFSEGAKSIGSEFLSNVSERIYNWRHFSKQEHEVIICKTVSLDVSHASLQWMSDIEEIAVVDLGSLDASEKHGIHMKFQNIREAIKQACYALCGEKSVTVIEVDPCGFPTIVAEAAVYGSFYRNEVEQNIPPESFYFDMGSTLTPVTIQHLQCSEQNTKALDESAKAFKEGLIIGECQNFARLLHGPGSWVTPEDFVKTLEEKFSAAEGIRFICRNENWMEQMNMEHILQVARMNRKCNSHGKYYNYLYHAPSLLEIHYSGACELSEPIVIIGKASFYHIYESYLQTEKRPLGQLIQNVSSGASIAATLLAMAYLKIPLNVKGIIPVCVHSLCLKKRTKLNCSTESDIFSEVPDSHEERLMLKDILSYSLNFNPSLIITVSTQTSYLSSSFQSAASIMYSSNDLLADYFLQVCSHTGERFIRLPFVEIDDDIFKECVLSKQFCTGCKNVFKAPIIAEIRNELMEYISKNWDFCFITSLCLKESTYNKKWLHLEVNKDLLLVQENMFDKEYEVSGAPCRSLIELCRRIYNESKLKDLIGIKL